MTQHHRFTAATISNQLLLPRLSHSRWKSDFAALNKLFAQKLFRVKDWTRLVMAHYADELKCDFGSFLIKFVYIQVQQSTEAVHVQSSRVVHERLYSDQRKVGKEDGIRGKNVSTPCLKKRRTLTCYNLDVHSSITIIFRTSVTTKAGNQNILYFPTSSNLCFCTTWGNRKPQNCIFSLKCCMLFTKTHETH